MFVSCNSTESCYFPSFQCKKAEKSTRIKCVCCRVVVHKECRPLLDEKQLCCRRTFREPLSDDISKANRGENEICRHHWVLRKRCDGGRCKKCGKKFEKERTLFGGGREGKGLLLYCYVRLTWQQQPDKRNKSCLSSNIMFMVQRKFSLYESML